MFTRREFTAAATAATAGLLARPAFSLTRPLLQDATLQVTELREGVWAILGGGGNSLVMRTGDGGILIDTKLPQVGDDLQTRVVELLGEMPRIVINTHHHGDHIGTNYMYCDDATIIGQQNIKPRLQETIDGWLKRVLTQLAGTAQREGDEAKAEKIARQAELLSVDQFAADESFDLEHTLERGTRKLMLKHLGIGAHTDNDAFIKLPEENIIHMGDLFFHNVHPFMDVEAGSNSTGWRKVVNAAMEVCDSETIVIPGHGEITNRTGLQEQIDYFDKFEEMANNAILSGLTREDLTKIDLGEYKTYGGGSRGYTNLQNVYDEVKAAGNV